MILTRSHQIFPRQYGLGLRVYRDIRDGGNIFSTLKRYVLPVGKYLFRNVLKPFVKNNKAEIQNASRQSMNIIKRLAAGKRLSTQDLKEDIGQIFKGKTLVDHLKGEGIYCVNNNNKRRKIK